MDYMADGKGVDEPNVLPSGDDLVRSHSKTWIGRSVERKDEAALSGAARSRSLPGSGHLQCRD